MINRSHDRKYQTNKGDVLSFVRKNLIDQAERVRNWEMLVSLFWSRAPLMSDSSMTHCGPFIQYDPDDLFSRVGLPFIRNEVSSVPLFVRWSAALRSHDILDNRPR